MQGNCNNSKKKVVYLTFDDGPSITNTNNIIDILNKNGVKGTFFVVGNKAAENKNILKKARNLGMSIYPHCNVHDYEKIYSSTDEYFKDLNLCENKINNVLNEKLDFKFVRLPGGSTNRVGKQSVLSGIKKELKSRNVMYVDWNIDSGDATASNVSSECIRKNIKNNAGAYRVEVVLMHDAEGKKSTVTTLENIINEYKLMNYEFKTLDNISNDDIQYLKDVKVINNN
ncbi:polysaccharide deacetylase family protein [Clostridium sardiniense]|uniref:polysaccharide deacetylase family protein n=1 Tax=Clostridium sardiniense TaxID=29369 RepID=UPI00311CBE4A